MKGHVSHCYEENVREQERLPFAWNFRVGFLGHMEQYISCGKNGSKYNAVPFVKIYPIELSRLGRVVPRFTMWGNGTSEICPNGTAYSGHFSWNEKRGIPLKAFLLLWKNFSEFNIWYFTPPQKWFFDTNSKRYKFHMPLNRKFRYKKQLARPRYHSFVIINSMRPELVRWYSCTSEAKMRNTRTSLAARLCFMM